MSSILSNDETYPGYPLRSETPPSANGLVRAEREDTQRTQPSLQLLEAVLFQRRQYSSNPLATHATMAPIYTAKHIASQEKTIPLFSIKNLNNLAPSTLSSINIIGVPLEKQVAFTQYADNISSFIHANVSRRTITVTGRPLGFLPRDGTIGLVPPPVQFILQKELNYEAADKFVNALGPGASKSKSGQTTVFHAPALDTKMYHQLQKVSSDHYNCGREAVTVAGAVTYQFLTTAIAEFLKIHTYAAFTCPPDESITSFTSLLKDGVSDYYTHKTKGGKVNIDPIQYSRTLYDIDVRDEESAMDEDESDVIAGMREPTGGFAFQGVDAVFSAKPSPVREANIGVSNSVPNLPGLVFPYFKGLIQPDSAFVNRFILKHLFPLLGSTIQECQNMYAKIIRRGANSMSTTDEGMVVTHILLGIELALSTQGRCFLIIESKTYKGFALLGSKYCVFDSSRWNVPSSAEDLRSDLDSLDSHLASVNLLVTKFQEMTTAEKYTGPAVDKDTFGAPANLIDVIKGIKLDSLDGDDEKSLDNAFRALNYMGKGYLAFNPQMVAEALETFFSDATINLDRPTYFPSIRTAVHTREFAILSRFGPDAPSLWNEKGSVYKCEAKESSVPEGSGKRKMGAMDTYTNLPEKILVTPKPLAIAVRDFGKVIAEGGIKIDLKERAKKFRNMSIEAEEMKKRVWKALVEGLKDSSKKRKLNEKTKEPDNVDYDDVMATLLGTL